jgi:hypothetical protein
MNNVYKNIEDVKVGDIVLGQDNSNNQVIDIEKVQLGSRLLYSFNGGAYFVTEEHPFMTKDGWKAINPKASYEETPHLNIDINQLKIGDILILNDKEVELKLIDWKSEEDQIVYNLLLNGNNTYYADDYLVHNKNMYKERDNTYGDGWQRLRDHFIDYATQMNEQSENAKFAFDNLTAQLKGIQESGGENENSDVGGSVGQIEATFQEAQNDYKTKRSETATKLAASGTEIGSAAESKSTELTAMIGKTNLVGAQERQQQELLRDVQKKWGIAQDEKETGLTEAERDMDLAETERQQELSENAIKAQGEFEELEEQVKADYEEIHRNWKSSYSSKRGDRSKQTSISDTEYMPARDSDKINKGHAGGANDGPDIAFNWEIPDAQGNFQQKTLVLSDHKVPKHAGYSANKSDSKYTYGNNVNSFKAFREKRASYNATSSCFIAGTKILMGGK